MILLPAGFFTYLLIMFILNAINKNVIQPAASVRAEIKREAQKDPIEKEFEKVYFDKILALKKRYSYFDDKKRFDYLSLNYYGDLYQLKKQFLAEKEKTAVSGFNSNDWKDVKVFK